MISPERLTKLRKILRLTTSSHDGEKLNALQHAADFMTKENISWDDILNSYENATTQTNTDHIFQEGYQQGVADTERRHNAQRHHYTSPKQTQKTKQKRTNSHTTGPKPRQKREIQGFRIPDTISGHIIDSQQVYTTNPSWRCVYILSQTARRDTLYGPLLLHEKNLNHTRIKIKFQVLKDYETPLPRLVPLHIVQ